MTVRTGIRRKPQQNPARYIDTQTDLTFTYSDTSHIGLVILFLGDQLQQQQQSWYCAMVWEWRLLTHSTGRAFQSVIVLGRNEFCWQGLMSSAEDRGELLVIALTRWQRLKFTFHLRSRKLPASLKPVLNWGNICSPNILRRTMIRFLIEL